MIDTHPPKIHTDGNEAPITPATGGNGQRNYALVTGGAKRIGKAIVTHLAAQGWHVVIHCNSSVKAANTLARELEQQYADGGQTFHVVTCDLNDRAATRQLIPTLQRDFGITLSLLVNNASLFEPDSLGDFNDQTLDFHMQVNLYAPMMLTQALAALPYDSSTPPKRNVVNIVDQRVWRLNPTFMSYTLSKSALWTFTQTAAQALAPAVRVNAIGPGPVLASIHQSATDFSDEATNVLLGHGPSADEIAQAISFILSSPSLTGQMLALDGGQHLAWQTPDLVPSSLPKTGQ